MSYQVFTDTQSYATYIRDNVSWNQYGTYGNPVINHYYDPDWIGDLTITLVRFQAPPGIFYQQDGLKMLNQYIPQAAVENSATPVYAKVWAGPGIDMTRSWWIMEVGCHGSILPAPVIIAIMATALGLAKWLAILIIAVVILVLIIKIGDGIRDALGGLGDILSGGGDLLKGVGKYILPIAVLAAGTIALVYYFNSKKPPLKLGGD